MCLLWTGMPQLSFEGDMRMKKTLLVSSLALAMGAVSLPASADFSGHYDPANWTITLTGVPPGGGPPVAVDTTGAPASITLIGGDSGCAQPLCTLQYTNSLNKEFLQFDWSYT